MELEELNADEALGFNAGLEYAALWVEGSAKGDSEPRVTSFAANMAMSIRSAKRSLKQEGLFDAVRMTNEETSDLNRQPIHDWFELSYAQFLTVPRLVMESMPLDWQRKMAALLQEMDDTFNWRPAEGRYWVRLKDARGRFTDAPLADYRHGSCEHLRKP